MASTMSKPGRQLRELLQQQQEPFILETHLKGRGCLEKSSTSEGGSAGCCHGDSTKLIRRPSSCGPQFFKGIPHCFKILRPRLDRLVSIAGNPKRKLYDHDECGMRFPEMGSKSQKVAEQQDGSSYGSSTTMFNSWSASDTEDSFASQKIHTPYSTATTIESLQQNKLKEEEVNTDRKIQGRSKKHKLQLEPVSVLGGSSMGQSNARTRKLEKLTRWKYGFCNRGVRKSVSLLELFVQSPNEKQRHGGVAELQELVWSNSSSQSFKSKRVLEQRKKLLFYYVREAVESHGRRKEKKRQSIGEPLGPEGIEQLVCQKMKEWGKHGGNETNLNHLLNMDFAASAQDWHDLKAESREVGLDVEEAILEEMMSEMVTETMHFT